MNLALVAANANQLKYLIETAEDRPLFYFSLAFIVASILVQLLVKICLMISCRFNLNNDDQARRAMRVNNFTIAGIAVIVLINVAISVVILLETQGIFPDKTVFL